MPTSTSAVPYKIDYSDSGLDPVLASAGNPYIKNAPVKPPTDVSVISSNQGKDIIEEAMTEHANETKAMTGGVSPLGKGNQPYDQSKDPNGGLTRIYNSKTGESSFASPGASLGPDWVSADEAAATGITIPQKATGGLNDVLDAEEREINSAFSSFGTMYDAATANLVKSTHDLYAELIRNERESMGTSRNTTANYLRSAGFTGMGVQGVLSGIERKGLDRIKKLSLDENAAIAQAEMARVDNNYKLFVAKRSEIKEIRQKKIASVIEVQKEAQKRIETAKKTQAIVDQMNKGVTDPKAILTNLNKEGGAYSAKDIEDVFKSLNPNADPTKLSADARDFFILKSMGGKSLPAAISSLPEDQQLMAYLKIKAEATRKATSPDKDTSDKITGAEATKYNMPPEMIGMSEKEVRLSLDNPEPPQWFLDVMKKRSGGNDSYLSATSAMSSLWEQFRLDVLAHVEPKEKISKDTRQKATEYFQNKYGDSEEEADTVQGMIDHVDELVQGGRSYEEAVDAAEAGPKANEYFRSAYAGTDISDDQLQALVNRVLYYVKAGKSYAQAITATEKDAEGEE